MPPPVVPQQGSKVGLISALVVCAILAVVMTVFFFQEQGKRRAAEAERDAIPKKYEGLVKLDDPALQLEKQVKEAGTYPGITTAVEVPRAEANMLAQAATGYELSAIVEASPTSRPAAAPSADGSGDASGGTTATAKRQAQIVRDYLIGGREGARRKLEAAGVDVRAAGLDNASNDIVKHLNWYADEYLKISAQAKKVGADAAAAATAQQARAVQDLAAATKTYTDQLTTLKAERDARDAQVAALTAALKTKQDEVANTQFADVSALNAKIAEAESRVPPLDARIKELEAKLKVYDPVFSRFRMDLRDNILTPQDGAITQIVGDGTCYINLGVGSQVSEGMTFEVYDQTGVPGMNADIPKYEDDFHRRGGDKGEAVAAAAERGTGGMTGVAAIAAKGGNGPKFGYSLPAGGKGSVEVIKVGPGSMSLCRIVKTEPQQTLKGGDLIANLVYDPRVKFRFAVFGDFDMDYDDRPKAADKATIRRLVEQWGGKLVDVKTAEDFAPDVDFVVVGIAPKVLVLTEAEQSDPQMIKLRDDSIAAKAAYDEVLKKARDFSIPVLNQTRFLYYTGYFDRRLR